LQATIVFADGEDTAKSHAAKSHAAYNHDAAGRHATAERRQRSPPEFWRYDTTGATEDRFTPGQSDHAAKRRLTAQQPRLAAADKPGETSASIIDALITVID
jgi:hypothetical protein